MFNLSDDYPGEKDHTTLWIFWVRSRNTENDIKIVMVHGNGVLLKVIKYCAKRTSTNTQQIRYGLSKIVISEHTVITRSDKPNDSKVTSQRIPVVFNNLARGR